MAMRKHFIFILVFLLISCSSNKSSDTSEISGTVESREVIVSSEVAGKIVWINFDEGDKVDSGFVLCQVDTELIYPKYLEGKAQAEMLYSQYQLLLKGAKSLSLALDLKNCLIFCNFVIQKLLKFKKLVRMHLEVTYYGE